MRQYLLPVVASFILIGQGTQQSEAKITVKERTVYYSVNGKTGKAIYEQIVRKGPKLPGKKGTHVATSTISFDARNIKGGVKGTRCVITNYDLVVNVVYRVPKWTGNGSPQLKRAWKNFSDHVWRHEYRHRDIGIEYAKRMERGAKSMTGDARRNCAGFEIKARELGRKSRAWHDRKQKSFDASWFGDGGRQFKYDRALVQAK